MRRRGTRRPWKLDLLGQLAKFFAAAEGVAERVLGPAGIEQATAVEAKAIGVGIAVEHVPVGDAKARESDAGF
ncbi:MAG: hypothetical protein B9S26_09675 [Opitutia bacterium Tous-C4FEB]|nr:MAG: hypothetical protein B9S35_11230 [Opitutae bacterium Tous-C5TDCM]PAW89091.1 MAG: hypothetical protein B9S26_09675 [Opitutae bacterium Tous-C4FEB]